MHKKANITLLQKSSTRFPMLYTPKQRQQLKARAHSLNPIVAIGYQGLTTAVNKEIDRALQDHELIKIRVNAEDRTTRKALLNEICQIHSAELIQQVGKIGVVYRKNPNVKS